MRERGLDGAVGFSRLFLRRAVRPGDRVIDATCGRGRDTLFLAGLVGESGTVWAFDVQEEALAETAARLREAGCSSRVRLVHAGHERLSAHVTEPLRAVVFNLGYLPGNRGGAVTRPETTLSALEQACALLTPGGVIVLAVYTGHEGGEAEAARIEAWAGALPGSEYHTWKSFQLNRSHTAPYVLVVEKMPLGGA